MVAFESAPRMPDTPIRTASRSPFADWPDGVAFGEHDGRVWFLPDAVICVEMSVVRVDVRSARAYLDTIRAIRDVEREAIARAGGLRFYQDFRSIRVIERDARAYLADATYADVGRWSIVSNKIELAPHNPIVRWSLQFIGKLISQMGLPGFDLSVDLASELARDGIRAPEPGPAYEARNAAYVRERDGAEI